MDSESLRNVSKTQKRYLALVAQGLSSKQIARLVGTAPSAIDIACKRAIRATGAESRFVLARLLSEHEPELIQSESQRWGLTPIKLAELRTEDPDGPVEPSGGAFPSIASDRQWDDLSPWKKRAWAMAVAFGALCLAMVLIEMSHQVLARSAASL